MQQPLPKLFLFIIFSVSCACMLNAQADQNDGLLYNTKRNFVFLNGSLGGGDYPFGSLGITLSRQFFNGETMAGIGVQYIGNTATDNYVDPVQVFPVMLDLRQKFMDSPDGRFSAFVIFDAGYVISITQNQTDETGEYEFKNGWGISPGVAFRYNILRNVGMMVDITWFHHSHPQVWKSPVEKKSTKNWNVGQVRGNIFF